MTRNYRNGDPATSAMAGREMETSGSAARQRSRCLEAVAEMPGLTAREIEDRIGIKAHKRLPELRQAGLVHNGPVRTCRMSGRMAMTWQPGDLAHETANTGDHA